MRRSPLRRFALPSLVLLLPLTLVARPAAAAPRDGAPPWLTAWSWLWGWLGGTGIEARVLPAGLIQDPYGRTGSPPPPPSPAGSGLEREALEEGAIQDPYGRASAPAGGGPDVPEAGLIQDPLG